MQAQEHAHSDTPSSARDTDIKLLTPEEFEENWATFAPFITRAVRRYFGRLRDDDVRKFVVDGEMLCIVMWDPGRMVIQAVAILEPVIYPRKTVLNVAYVSAVDGEIDTHGWRSLWEAAKEFGRGIGASQIETVGRRGWGRRLELREVASVYVEDI